MAEAEIIAIGTELLLGEIQDSNSRFIATRLREAGIDLHRITIVGDNIRRISQVIRESLTRVDMVITCGGLGPTIDDPTREAVALAMDAPLEFSTMLWEQITARFQRMNRKITENNRRQAFIPQGSVPVENPVGTAPCFILTKNGKTITSLPGVPHEMEYLFVQKILPQLIRTIQNPSFIKKTVLHVSGMGESVIDDLIEDLEKLSNPTVGLAAHFGQIDVRITAKAETENQADQMLQEIAAIIKEKLGDYIYGVDDVLLVDVVKDELAKSKKNLVVREYNLHGELGKNFKKTNFTEFEDENIDLPLSFDELIKEIKAQIIHKNQALAGVSLIQVASTRHLAMVLKFDHNIFSEERIFGDLDSPLFPWAYNIILDFLRKNLKQRKTNEKS
jgi:competence/damage-inducible protein CinA-like protein